MANRLSDTAIWDKPWFRKLSPLMKCVWRYLIDNCDHAGIWEIDEENFEHYIGVEVSINQILEIKALQDRIQKVGSDKLFIPGFITYQYKIQSLSGLNPLNKVHKSVISRLQSLQLLSPLEAPNKPHIDDHQAPSNGAKEEDKEQDKAKDILKKRIFEIFENYYPLQIGGSLGVALLLPEMQHENDLSDLKRAILAYADSLTPKNIGFIKHFNNWVADNWRDWLSPKAGKVILLQNKSGPSIQQQQNSEMLAREISDKSFAEIIDENKEIIQNLNPVFKQKLEEISKISSSRAAQTSGNENDNRNATGKFSENI